MAAAPLQGLTVLNTRDARGAPALTGLLRAQGAHVLECPTIALLPPESWAPFDERLKSLGPGDWVVFTSANAVRAALERLAALGRPPAALAAARLAAIGRGTGAALREAGLSPDIAPANARQESLLEALLGALGPGEPAWIPRAQEARAVLEEGLRAAGHPVAVTPVYRTAPPPGGLGPVRQALLAGRVDWVLFTSSSTVANFWALLDEEARGRLAGCWPRVACIGEVTARTAREHGLPVTVVPARQELAALVAAVVDWVWGESTGRPGRPARSDP